MSRSLRPYLEYQADRVEGVLTAHRAPGRVTGGTVGPRLIRFYVQPAPHVRYAAISRLADDLALAMQVTALSVNRGKEGVILEFSNPNPRPVTLLNLLSEVMPIPLSAALLGLTDDGTPLLARLSAPEVSHVLVAGTTGSGKSALLRTIAASLALTHTSNLLQMLCIDPKGRAFPAFHNLPHLTRPPIVAVPEALEALRSVVRVMESRDRLGETPVASREAITTQRDGVQGTSVPRIVIFIDELADLVMQGEAPLLDVITRLVQRGRQAGVHVIAATQHPAATVLSGVMRANFPLRLVGKVVSADDARVASGRAGTNAHLLNGRGDFLAVSGGDTPIRFQGAYINERDLEQQMQTLGASRSSYTHPLTITNGTLLPEIAEAAPVASDSLALPAPQPADRVQQAIVALRPQWGSLRDAWAEGEHGIKSRVCRIAFGENTPYGGSFVEWLDEAVEILEAEHSSTSTSTAAHTHSSTAKTLDMSISTGRGRGRTLKNNSLKEAAYA